MRNDGDGYGDMGARFDDVPGDRRDPVPQPHRVKAGMCYAGYVRWFPETHGSVP
jgi:hypothetical protein